MKKNTFTLYMKKLFVGLFLSVLFMPVWAQNQNDNLTKYWKYRDRLRNRFMVVSGNVENPGVNIPAAFINYTDNIADWGDANSNMSHYLSVLATELWLLKNNNQDYSTTLKELYYAMLAMERLDTYSEYQIRISKNLPNPAVDAANDINGFHLRDDITSGFWSNNSSHFGVSDYQSCFRQKTPQNDLYECSQDVIYHNMEGLALVAKLIGTESVSGIPVTFTNNYIPNRLTSVGIKSGNSINFSLWAQDFMKRYIRWVQDWTIKIFWGLPSHWYVLNAVTGDLVRDGNGNDADMGGFYHYGIIKAGEAITGQTDLRVYGGILPAAVTEKVYTDLFRTHSVQVPPPPNPILILVDVIFGGAYQNINFDDYKLRSLSATGNVLGAETFSILRTHRDNYNFRKPGYFPCYENIPLQYLVLHDPNYTVMTVAGNVYNSDKVLYENLLNSAPLCGPASNCGVYDWTSRSRCVWPERLGEFPSSSNVAYSGLDYMMLHNLYYIAFRKEDFKKLSIDAGSAYRSTSASSGIIEVNTSITGISVIYTASNCVKMNSGFSVSGGKSFKATILHRANNYQGDAYKVLTATDCVSSLKSATVNQGYDDNQDNIPEFTEPMQIEKNVTSNPEDLIFEKSEISIFPNPSKGFITISPGNSFLPLNFEIVNFNGSIVYQGSIDSDMQQVDLSILQKGIYLIRFHLKDKIYSKKLSLIY
jgi:hypothetical protein